MGNITIQTAGSFGSSHREFSAVNHGHVDAVAQAIEYLSKEWLPIAIAMDTRLQSEGLTPDLGFNRNQPEIKR